MSKTKKIFSLIMVGLLLISAGHVFAAEDSSAGEDISLEEAAKSLEQKLIMRGDVFALSRYGEKGIIFVLVGSEMDKRWIPDYWEGFPVWKQVGEATSLMYFQGPTQETIDYYTGRQEPATSSQTQTGQSTWTRQINPLVSSISPSSISFDTSYVGALDNNKTLPNIQNIEIKSRMAEFSTPPIPKIPEFPAITQPGNHNTGMLMFHQLYFDR